MRTGIALFCLFGITLIFELNNLWPKSSDYEPEDYQYINLSAEDSVKAINNFKKNVYLNEIGFYRKFFPFSDQVLTKRTYVYFIVQHLFLIGILILWYNESSEYSKDFVRMFLLLMIGDFLDYIMIYNDHYGHGLSYNVIVTIFFMLFLTYKYCIEQWKQAN